jgi:N-acetylneuraminate lyase
MSKKIAGLIAATHTPFDGQGKIKPEAQEPVVKHLVKNGVTGIFLCGSTGESHSLSTEERKEIAAAMIGYAAGKLPVIVHVGHNSLPEAAALAAHAEETGAAAVAVSAPSFFKPPRAEELVAFCAEVAAAAPRTPFYYYHIPSRAGGTVSALSFLEAAHNRIPNLAGIKYTYEDLMEYQQMIAFADGKYDIMFGRDEILLAALGLGATSAIGTTYNYAAPIFRRVWESFDKGDLTEARKWQLKAVRLVELLVKYGGLDCSKQIMKIIGFDCGAVRLPNRRLGADEIKFLEKDLHRIDFFADAV